MAGVAGAGEGSHVSARERACGFKNAPALAPLGEKTPRRAASRLAAAERRRAWLDLSNRKVNGGGFHSRVHTCVSSRGRRVCEHTGAEAMAAGQDGGGATVSGKRRLRKGSARGVEGSGTCKRFPSMTRRPASHGGKRSSAKVFGSITAHKAASRPWLEGQVPQREVERGAHHWSKGTRR
jgi:hypothetical protein